MSTATATTITAHTKATIIKVHRRSHGIACGNAMGLNAFEKPKPAALPKAMLRGPQANLFVQRSSNRYLPPMPTPGKRWYHATFSTLNSWLPGDPRGFRSKHHRIHSSGDHRHPPPKGEHAGLHAYAKSIAAQPILLATTLRPIVGKAVHQSLDKHRVQTLAIAVGAMHVHLLVELPIDLQQAKAIIGYAKLSASMRIKSSLPGRVWARGCKPKPIRDEKHHRNTFNYILRHVNEGAWVWSFRDGPMEGRK